MFHTSHREGPLSDIGVRSHMAQFEPMASSPGLGGPD